MLNTLAPIPIRNSVVNKPANKSGPKERVSKPTKKEIEREISELNRRHNSKKKKAKVDFPGIILYWGDFGMGKTLMAAAAAAEAYANGIEVYHAGDGCLRFGTPWNFQKLLNGGYENCIIFIDELRRLMARERSMAGTQVDLIDVLIALRRHNVQVIATDQEPSENNSKLIRRVRHEILCISKVSGRFIDLTLKRHRWNRPSIIKRYTSEDMRWAWALYDSYYHTATGVFRRSKADQKAELEHLQYEKTGLAVANLAQRGVTETSVFEVIREVKLRNPELTIAGNKMAEYLTGWRLEPEKKRTNNVWIIPDEFLDQFEFEEVVA